MLYVANWNMGAGVDDEWWFMFIDNRYVKQS